MSLHIGLGPFTGQAAPGGTATDGYRDLLTLAQTAEEEGFDAFWVSEHHGVDDGYLPSLAIALAAAGAVTSRVRLGMAVSLAPFQHPIRFAEDCAVTDLLSGGRLIVGLGIGWRKEEFKAFGIPMKERVGYTLDLVEFCRAAWQGERFTFEGRHFSARDILVTPAPEQSIPIMLGGSAESAIVRAGRIADGLMATPQNDLGKYRSQVAALDAAALAAGREASALSIGFHVNVWVSPDGAFPERVRQAMWHQMGKHIELRQIDEGVLLNGPPPIDDEHIQARTIVGTPADVLDSLRPWVSDFGSGREQHVVVRLAFPGLAVDETAEAARLFAEQVIPGLREAAGD